jgi:hypothetical protein
MFLVARAYPPAVGVTSKSRDCGVCHKDNGPWSDEAKTVIDVLDGKTKLSLKQPDGTFLIDVSRGQTRTVITVIGRTADDTTSPPRRNAWLYVDPSQIETSSLSKFAPGWEVTLPMSCRLVGDPADSYPEAKVTSLPMTIRPGDGARDAVLDLQVMLTDGDVIKGKGDEGLILNYYLRTVRLHVVE